MMLCATGVFPVAGTLSHPQLRDSLLLSPQGQLHRASRAPLFLHLSLLHKAQLPHGCRHPSTWDIFHCLSQVQEVEQLGLEPMWDASTAGQLWPSATPLSQCPLLRLVWDSGFSADPWPPLVGNEM